MIIDGRAIAGRLLTNLKQEIKSLPRAPTLAVIVMGNDPSSAAYIKQKTLKSKEIGANCQVIELDDNTSEKELQNKVNELNNDKDINGIIIQRPLPPHINPEPVNEWVVPEKDVDGFNSKTMFIPPIALAVLEILKSINITPQNKKIVVIGRGETGGKPIANNLIQNGAIVTICHSKTPNISEFTNQAEIVISCVGKYIVRREMLNRNTILIGVGMHKNEEGHLRADYNEEEIKDVVMYYTPVPGGVGPVNVACLLTNLVKASKNSL